MAADTVVLTVCIPVALQQQLDTVAQAMERSRAWVITQALEHFVAVQAWQVEAIHKALAEADAGDFATVEEIAALNTTYQS
jgi:RHH-type rel operon transcriptional repressor/antitoxin RelB